MRGFFRRTAAMWACAVFLLAAVVMLTNTVSASASSRSLSLYFTHTKESITVTFKRNGRYIPSGLKKLNRFLRDWRRNEPTRMDPRLFDLVWEVYRKSGSRKPIQVISGYRSPKTNAALRRRGRHVARKSQHMKGKALDFFLQDVSVKKLRELGLHAEVGGVGYYPGSFVHLDTGSVRYWPRMSRSQLARIFPRGRTLYIPSDGKPLAGYQYALARYKKRKRTGGPILIASAASAKTKKTKKNFITRMFGRAAEEDGAVTATRKPAKKRPENKKPAKVVVASARAAGNKKSQLPGVDIASVPAAAVVAQPVVEKPKLLSVIPKRVIVPKSRPGSKAVRPEAVLVAAADPRKGTDKVATLIAERFKTEEVTQPVRKPALAIKDTRFALVEPPQLTATQRAAEILNRASRSAKPVPVSHPVGETKALGEVISAALREKSSALAGGAVATRRPNLESHPLKPVVAERAGKVRATVPKKADRIESTFAALSGDKGFTASIPQARPTRVASLGDIQTTPTHRPVDMFGAPAKAKAPAKTIRPKVRKAKAKRVVRRATTFQLGNLNGKDVTVWATSHSTRVGRLAKLTAPRYLGVLENVPDSIFSNGFSNAVKVNRTNRFSGQAIRRIAFAKFMTGEMPRDQIFPTDRF